jgi:hypothetical protein
MANKWLPPNKEDYEEFAANYKGLQVPIRAYLALATGDSRYRMRQDIFRGEYTSDNLPSRESVQRRQDRNPFQRRR